MRLDAFLAGKSDIRSRSEAKRMIDAGLVKVNGKVTTKASMEVSGADEIQYTPPPSPAIPNDDASITLTILYEDDACLVINKPAGLIVHPGNGMQPGTLTLLDALRPLFHERLLPFSESSVLVHRLDKDTTGCLLIAKTPEAHMALQKQFELRTTKKKYLTLVAGVPKKPTATIDIPVGRDVSARTKMSVHRSSGTRSAQTTYRTVSTAEGAALLECDLHTGRTHQIRVHLQAIGHPVLGDDTYGDVASKALSKKLGIRTILLHAWTLSFLSPASQKEVSVRAPLPTHFSDFLRSIGAPFTEST